MSISRKQLAYIHILAKQLSWDRDFLHEMLEEVCGVDSLKLLSLEQTQQFIKYLKACIGDTGKLTDKQAWKIKDVWKVLDYSQMQEGDIHLKSFLQKRFRVNDLYELSKQQAWSCINALEKMKVQKQKRQGEVSLMKKLKPCVYCGTPIQWIEGTKGKRTPYEVGEAKTLTKLHICPNLKYN